MFIFYYSVLATIILSSQSVKTIGNNSVFEDVKGWTVFGLFSKVDTCRFYFVCADCPHLSEGLKINIYFNERIDIFYFNPNYHGFRKEHNPYFVTLYHKYKFVKDNHAFSNDVSIIFSRRVKSARKTVTSVSINDEVLFAKPDFINEDNTNYFLDSKLPPYRGSCEEIVKKVNFCFDSSSTEYNLTIQFVNENPIRGMILGLKFSFLLVEIRSPDFLVERGLHDRWILKDYGYYLEAKKTVELNLTIIAKELIQNGIPLSIILSNEIVCGNFTTTELRDFASEVSKDESIPVHEDDYDNETSKRVELRKLE